MKFLPPLLFTLLLPFTVVAERSLTLSPFSATYHGTVDKDSPAYRAMDHSQGDGRLTRHLGLSAKLKDGNDTYSAFVFKDSFKNLAGGLIYGQEFDFLKYISIGVAGGLYVREQPSKTNPGVKNFPISIKLEDVEIAPMGGVTAKVGVPVTKKINVETNCLANLIINNCQLGLGFKF